MQLSMPECMALADVGDTVIADGRRYTVTWVNFIMCKRGVRVRNKATGQYYDLQGVAEPGSPVTLVRRNA